MCVLFGCVLIAIADGHGKRGNLRGDIPEVDPV